MARRPRLRMAGVPQHVIQRGNNRQATFFADEDYRFYVDCLCKAARRHQCAVHAYVLMTNHVHLLVTAGQPDSISLAMRDLGRRYVQYVNFVYRRTGSLWEGRFRAGLVDSEVYFLRCCRYIELNPVRAQMVARPGDYRWSSYRCHADGTPDRLVSTHEQYERLGVTSDERQFAYRALFLSELDSTELSAIRDAVNRGWPLGSERFRDEIEAALQRAARPPKRGRPSRRDAAFEM